MNNLNNKLINHKMEGPVKKISKEEMIYDTVVMQRTINIFYIQFSFIYITLIICLSEDALQTPAPEPPESALKYQWQANSLNLTFSLDMNARVHDVCAV